MKKQIFTVLLPAIALFASAGCCKISEKKIAALVPQPNCSEAHCGSYKITEAAFAVDESAADPRTLNAVTEFAGQLSLVSGLAGTVTEVSADALPSNGFVFAADPSVAPEGYRLEITRRGAVVHASEFAGFFYAIQTLKQLLPVEIYGDAPACSADWSLPCLTIDDAPRFAYRGLHSDVSRHFFDMDEMKRYIDIMAIHKLNTLHWHLTDDQGWRIEIKKYPKLTEVGSVRKGTMIKKQWGSNDGVIHSGYFTQEQIREIVEYAAARAINVVPEIDLPGHMLAALTAYPELGCTGGPYEVWTRWGVSDDVLCAGNEKTYTFIEDVLTEVMELFPSKYIHIGGDECPKEHWKKCPRCQARIKALGLKDTEKFTAEQYLQSYVTTRVEKFITEHGRRIIGWDEILEGELSPDAIVMSWRGSAGGIEAAKQHHEVIMTPNSHFYFDYYQSLDTDNEPFGIGGYVPVEKVYSFDPYDQLTEEQQQYILGVQANMWTEYVSEPWHLEYMILPRLSALSEVQWCNAEVRDYERFLANFRLHEIFDIMGYTYAKHIFGTQGITRVNPEKGCVTVELITSGDAPIYYTLDGSEPDADATRYTRPVEIRGACVLKAASLRKGVEGPVYSRSFEQSKTTGRKVELNTEPTLRYRFNAPDSFTDGHHGAASFSNNEWVGYLDNPCDLTIDMNGVGTYSSVTVETCVEKDNWIFPPSAIKVSLSDDGENFEEVAALFIPEAAKSDSDGVINYTAEFPETSARYMRIEAATSKIPAWHPAHDKKAHLFVGEISAE